jgi:uncharacterized small protein (DUF1192 family)
VIIRVGLVLVLGFDLGLVLGLVLVKEKKRIEEIKAEVDKLKAPKSNKKRGRKGWG